MANGSQHGWKNFLRCWSVPSTANITSITTKTKRHYTGTYLHNILGWLCTLIFQLFFLIFTTFFKKFSQLFQHLSVVNLTFFFAIQSFFDYYFYASTGLTFKSSFLFFTVAPMIWVQNQLEYAIVGRNVSLHCNTESYPPAIHYWRLGNQTAISSGNYRNFLKVW